MIIFTLTRIAGDPIAVYAGPQATAQQLAEITREYGFNQPIYVQYLYYVKGLLHGDLGYSVTAGLPVNVAIERFFPATLELAIYATLFSIIVGIYLGTKSAVHRNRPIDHGARMTALVGASIPSFWLGLVLIFLFYFEFGILGPGRLSPTIIQTYFPPNGNFHTYTGLLTVDAILNLNFPVFINAVEHLILPVITLGLVNTAIIARITRSSMLESMQQDYVKYARAKGLPENDVISNHARRNALIPVTTVAGLTLAMTLTGSVLIENVFDWPGVGRWAAQAALALDHAAVLGFVIFVAVIYILVNLIVDIIYAYIDPRIKLQ